jgi:hypothetical protein
MSTEAVLMRVHQQVGVFVLASAVAAVCAPAGAAQSPSATTTARKSTGKLLTLDGCVSPSAATSGQWVLSDTKGRGMYRLSGTEAHEYVGRRVQVSGVPSRRVRIVGGLYPSPNVAAQAGAIDSTQAAMAAASAAAGTTPLPELRVKSVQVVAGSCPQR